MSNPGYYYLKGKESSDINKMLTREQVETAKQNRSHIAIEIFDSLGDEYWKKLAESAKVEDNQEVQRVYAKGFLPFAGALEGNLFTLNPLEIISIWSKKRELFEMRPYPGYQLATILSCAYGAQSLESKKWKNLFTRLFSSSEGRDSFRDLCKKDAASSKIFFNRLEEIRLSLSDIAHYREGTRESFVDLSRKAYLEKDQLSLKKLDEIEARIKEYDSDGFLGAISENWGNGMLRAPY